MQKIYLVPLALSMLCSLPIDLIAKCKSCPQESSSSYSEPRRTRPTRTKVVEQSIDNESEEDVAPAREPRVRSTKSGGKVKHFEQLVSEHGSAEQAMSYLEKQDSVIIDFYADWCRPCQRFGPVFEKAAGEHREVIFVKVNYDHHQNIANKYSVRSLPTVIFLKNGRKVADFKRPLTGAQIGAEIRKSF